MKSTKEFELMAPAGNEASLKAAIQAGADAVYFGVDNLNMRARASRTFKRADMHNVAEMCRHANVRSYLALNTIIYDDELKQVREICDAALEAGITAVIATDLSVVRYASQIGLQVHLSTQANISNIEAVKHYAQFATVMVLARELTLQQINHICWRIEKEQITGPDGNLVSIELFVHGALCVSIAGKCYMSLAATNQSANRGLCLQTCRRRYRVIDESTGEELDIENKFVMSPKDLCTIGYMDRLMESGATVFKIEGRARAADYVFTVTQAYRQAIDAVLQDEFNPRRVEQWIQSLESVFNRGFWHGGYYLGHPLGEWSAAYGSKATREKVYLGYVSNYYQKSDIGEFCIENNELFSGEKVGVIGPTTGYAETVAETLYVDGEPAEKAVKGDRVTIPFSEKLRRNDKLYAIRDRSLWQN
ncbi:MAG: peptidase U32 family protein [candidate division KSB1 bacterium]|nr:peptidase U32 family protein [candidate division KSB1 bacterium]